MGQIYLGTEIKLNVHVEPIEDYTMDDYDFKVQLYCSSSRVENFNKSDTVRVDDSNYICCLDTSKIGTGRLKCKIVAELPDGDFGDQKRTEINVIDTGIEITKGW